MSALSKGDIRKEIAERKKLHYLPAIKECSGKIFEQIEALPEFRKATTILLYHSLEDEVYTHDFIEKWYQTKNILLPVVIGNNLELYKYEGKDKIKEGAYGIKEPIGTPYTKLSEIELAIIPGIAFDRNCSRLGRGKGYYDRLLPSLKCTEIGICFSFQLVDYIPCEAHDINMHHVITESDIISSLPENKKNKH